MYGIIDKNNLSEIEVVYTYPLKSNMSQVVLHQPFSINDNWIKITYPFSNIVYDYKNKDSFFIENGKNNIEKNLLESKFKDVNESYASLRMNLVREEKYNSGLDNYFENERYIFFDNIFFFESYLWDKHLNKGYKLINTSILELHLGSFDFTDENSVIRILSSDNFQDSSLERLANDKEAILYPILQDYDIEYDNPILIFYTFKNE